MINLQNAKRFRADYITISLIVVVSIVLLLTLFTGLTSIKETITFLLIIMLLSFLTADIKNYSIKKKSSAYKYVVLLFLFSYITLF